MRRWVAAATLVAAAVAIAGCGSTVRQGRDPSSLAGAGNVASADDLGMVSPTHVGVAATVGAPGGSTPERPTTASGAAAAGPSAPAQGGGAPGTGPAVAGRPPGGGAGVATTSAPGPAAGPPSAPPPAAPADNLAAPVRGVEGEEVRVGFGVQDDAGEVSEALNLGVTFGNGRLQVQALVDELNARGGLAGHSVTPVFHNISAAQSNTDGASAGQAACAAWTEDTTVYAVISSVATHETLADCLAQHGTPLLESPVSARPEEVYGLYPDTLFHPGLLNTSRAMEPLVSRAQAQGYFEPAPPATEPVIGLVRVDHWAHESIATRLHEALARRGYAVTEEVAINASSYDNLAAGVSNAVLRMRAAGVTHVLFFDATALFFGTAAEQQQYRPRYAIHSTMAPATLLQGTMPPEQLRGAVGIGWLPWNDVDNGNDPGPVSEAETRCRDLMAAAGEDMTNRPGAGSALIRCDATWTLEAAVNAAGGLTADGVRRGIDSLGSSVPSALTFQTMWGAGRHDSAGLVRDLAWDADCPCFRYGEPATPA